MSAYALNLEPRSPLAGSFQMDADRILEVIALGLSPAAMRVLLFLASRMGPGNRVEICKAHVARDLHLSRNTVTRAVESLKDARLLCASEDGSAIVNPLYLLSDGADRDGLVERFGVTAIAPRRAPQTKKNASAKKRHLHLVT